MTMRDSKVIGTGACFVTLGAAAAIYFSIGAGFGPRVDPTPHEATGLVMAQQALALLRPGGRIGLIARDTATFKNPASDFQLAAFRKATSKAGASLSSLHSLQVDPLRPVEVPAGDFFELIRKWRAGDVLVSFMGPPLLTEAQRSQLGENKPAIVAFCSGGLPNQIDLPLLFEQGLLQAAVVSKRNAPVSGSKPATVQECFDRSFLVITSANLALLPPPSSASP